MFGGMRTGMGESLDSVSEVDNDIDGWQDDFPLVGLVRLAYVCGIRDWIRHPLHIGDLAESMSFHDYCRCQFHRNEKLRCSHIGS